MKITITDLSPQDHEALSAVLEVLQARADAEGRGVRWTNETMREGEGIAGTPVYHIHLSRSYRDDEL